MSGAGRAWFCVCQRANPEADRFCAACGHPRPGLPPTRRAVARPVPRRRGPRWVLGAVLAVQGLALVGAGMLVERSRRPAVLYPVPIQSPPMLLPVPARFAPPPTPPEFVAGPRRTEGRRY
jgi:hypothetical protein